MKRLFFDLLLSMLFFGIIAASVSGYVLHTPDELSDIAINTSNYSLCETYDEHYTAMGWVDDCYAKIAWKTGDSLLCISVLNDLRRSYCYTYLAFISQNESLCDKAKSPESRGSCYADIAEVKGDSSLCDNIQNSSWYSNCYPRVGIKTKNASLCEKTNSSSDKNECYRFIAKETGNHLLCDKIQDEYWKEICYSDVARNSSIDVSVCEKIKYSRFECYNGKTDVFFIVQVLFLTAVILIFVISALIFLKNRISVLSDNVIAYFFVSSGLVCLVLSIASLLVDFSVGSFRITSFIFVEMTLIQFVSVLVEPNLKLAIHQSLKGSTPLETESVQKIKKLGNLFKIIGLTGSILLPVSAAVFLILLATTKAVTATGGGSGIFGAFVLFSVLAGLLLLSGLIIVILCVFTYRIGKNLEDKEKFKKRRTYHRVLLMTLIINLVTLPFVILLSLTPPSFLLTRALGDFRDFLLLIASPSLFYILFSLFYLSSLLYLSRFRKLFE